VEGPRHRSFRFIRRALDDMLAGTDDEDRDVTP
jgi:hypothetical protein